MKECRDCGVEFEPLGQYRHNRCPDCLRIYFREYHRGFSKSADQRAKAKKRKSKYVSNNTGKVSARNIAYLAIRRGDLIRMPCVKCGNTTVHAHHNDYSKPLKVIWLCALHHTQLHARKLRATTPKP